MNTSRYSNIISIDSIKWYDNVILIQYDTIWFNITYHDMKWNAWYNVIFLYNSQYIHNMISYAILWYNIYCYTMMYFHSNIWIHNLGLRNSLQRCASKCRCDSAGRFLFCLVIVWPTAVLGPAGPSPWKPVFGIQPAWWLTGDPCFFFLMDD